MRAKTLGIPTIPSAFTYPTKIYQKQQGATTGFIAMIIPLSQKIYQKLTGGNNSTVFLQKIIHLRFYQKLTRGYNSVIERYAIWYLKFYQKLTGRLQQKQDVYIAFESLARNKEIYNVI